MPDSDGRPNREAGRDNRWKLDAPILAFDYPWEDGDQIRACGDCLPWYAEIYREPGDDRIWVREWHAVGCGFWDDDDD